MDPEIDCKVLDIGAWRALRASCELVGPTVERLEPKLMDLLFSLATRSGRVVGREELLATLWPGLIVGEDTLARAVSRLRKALGDDPKAPRYIETIVKRGYRCIADVRLDPSAPSACRSLQPMTPASASQPPQRGGRWSLRCAGVTAGAFALALVLIGHVWRPSTNDLASVQRQVLIERADDFYMRYARADNEAAIQLYEQVLARDGADAHASAGLANALVQRVVRWPHPPGEGVEYTRLGDALAGGVLDGPTARATLARAHLLAERAVVAAPTDAVAYKALGFTDSAQRNFDGALAAYARAVSLDADAWGPLINRSDVLDISRHPAEALDALEAAHAAMTRVYAREKMQVLPWYADLGVMIGDRHRSFGHRERAERWYRDVLAFAPLQPAATERLASLMREPGHGMAAQPSCSERHSHSLHSTECG
ncbi:MAG: winged helix-turn-helix domain-containing protein [Dokdonella sp.]|uniref:winged helix-turn-helix domain-containing protein n=1 Tax=Dokdonella sp. TaxID=2291710 RepID=UPI003265E12C